MKRKIVAVTGALLILLTGLLAGAAIARHGGGHRAVYRQVDGPEFFPRTVVIRCRGWAEDSANLRLVEFEGERVVYRCVIP